MTTPTHNSWARMIERCCRPTATNYHRYGGRGITVCARWMKFPAFLQDMGERPAGTTLDRIDNNGNYEPGNCRWATNHEQQSNRRTNVFLTKDGVTKTMTDWAKTIGCSRATLWERYDKGLPAEQVLAPKLQQQTLTPEKVAEIRWLHSKKVPIENIAAAFKVSVAHTRKVIKGQRWGSL